MIKWTRTSRSSTKNSLWAQDDAEKGRVDADLMREEFAAAKLHVSTLHLQPYTLSPEPHTLNPTPSTLNPKP